MLERTLYEDRLRMHMWLIFVLPSISLLFSIACHFGLHSIDVIGTSMFPTIQHRDAHACVERFSPQRLDIVYVYHNGQQLCKRVVGLPGDRITLDGNNLYINSQMVHEYYLFEKPEYEHLDIVLADNEYFVMGDNRNVSMDSRSIGPVLEQQIIGKLAFRLWRQ